MAAELDLRAPTVGAWPAMQPEGPKVGLVMPLATVRGGAEQMLLDLCRQRTVTRSRLAVAFLEDGPLVGTVRSLGLPVALIPRGQLRQPHRFAATVARLAQWVRSERLEGVVSWMPLAHLYAGPAGLATVGADRVVWFQHGLVSRKATAWMDWLPARVPAREVWLPSRHTAEAHRRLAPELSVRVIYPSVDLARFAPARLPSASEARRRLGLPATTPTVGMVSRLEPWKGCTTLVAAAPAILRRMPEARFVIVGGPHFSAPDYPERLRAMAAKLGVHERFTWAGHQADVPTWMQAMDVVVHASWGEPFGMTVLEAMALGKPVVAAASGGPLESVRDGVDGLLVPPGEPGSLADAVSRFLQHPAEARAFGARAQVRAQHFSASEMARTVGASLHSVFS